METGGPNLNLNAWHISIQEMLSSFLPSVQGEKGDPQAQAGAGQRFCSSCALGKLPLGVIIDEKQAFTCLGLLT